MKNESSWGGKRENAGRPQGSMNLATKDKVLAEQALKERIITNSQRILDKQLALAEGCQYLFVIKTEVNEKGKKVKSKPELVTDEFTIRDYLNGEFDGQDDEYYFMTTERPDTKVLDSLLDRAFGKASQSIDMTTKGKSINPVMDLSKLSPNELLELAKLTDKATDK